MHTTTAIGGITALHGSHNPSPPLSADTAHKWLTDIPVGVSQKQACHLLQMRQMADWRRPKC
ncbi:hypothetical protein M2281_003739 [Mesorhizobium soli]|nr:hypothetical protein [Mesorhizobium soli]